MRRRSSTWSGADLRRGQTKPSKEVCRHHTMEIQGYHVYRAETWKDVLNMEEGKKEKGCKLKEVPTQPQPSPCLCRPGFPPRGSCRNPLAHLSPSGARVEDLPDVKCTFMTQWFFYILVHILLLALFASLLMCFLYGQGYVNVYQLPVETQEEFNTYVEQGEEKVFIINNTNPMANLKFLLNGPFEEKYIPNSSELIMEFRFERLYFLKTDFDLTELDIGLNLARERRHSSYRQWRNISDSVKGDISSKSFATIKEDEPLAFNLVKPYNFLHYTKKDIILKTNFPDFRKGGVPGRRGPLNETTYAKNTEDKDIVVIYAFVAYVRSRNASSFIADHLAFSMKVADGETFSFTTSTTTFPPATIITPGTGAKYAYGLIFLLLVLLALQTDRASAVCAVGAASIAMLAYEKLRPQADFLLRWVQFDYLMGLQFVMLVNAITADTGFFDITAIALVKVTKKSFRSIMITFLLFVLIFSSVFDGVIAMLVITPYVLRTMEHIKRDPVPALVTLSVYSQIISTGFEHGCHYNRIILRRWEAMAKALIRRRWDFMLMVLPCVAILLLITTIYFYICFKRFKPHKYTRPYQVMGRLRKQLLWRRILEAAPHGSGNWHIINRELEECERELDQMPLTDEYLDLPQSYHELRDGALLQRVIEVVIAFFIIIILRNLQMYGFEKMGLGGVAAMCSILLLARANTKNLNAILSRIDWTTLFMLVSLYVLGNALLLLRLHDSIANDLKSLLPTKTNETAIKTEKRSVSYAVLGISALMSAIISNVGASEVVIGTCMRACGDMYQLEMNDVEYSFNALVLASVLGCAIGGSATILGSPVAFATSVSATQQGHHIGAMPFIAIAGPLALINLLAAYVYIYVYLVKFIK